MVQASNILVGRDGRVRLSDLGVAAKLERHFSGAHHAFGSLERRNTFVGSPAYIAPELLTGIDKGWVTEGITHLFTHPHFFTFPHVSPSLACDAWQLHTYTSSQPIHYWTCRYGLPADLYSFGVTLVEVAVGHTPYVDLSFEQIAISKVSCDTVPMLAVDAHGKRFSQVCFSHLVPLHIL